MISIITAIGKNNELGNKNDLLWNLPADMKHFRETTRGHTVIMGQKTFESLGRSPTGEPIGKPLPDRRNIILTQDNSFWSEGIEISRSLDEALSFLKNPEEEIFIIGGGQIYKLFMNKTDKLYITHVNESFPEADIYFPAIDLNIWEKTKSTKFPKDAFNQYNLEFAEYTKKVS